MPLFGLLKKKSAPISFYPGYATGGFRLATGTRIDCKDVKGQFNAYVNCPPVATVITTKATAAGNAVWWFGKEDGTATVNQTTDKYRQLFNKPNEHQDWNRFFTLAYIMHQLHGKAYIWVTKPAGMPTRYASSMMVIPNQHVTPNYKRDGSLGVKNYTVYLAGKISTVDSEDMMVWNDFTYDISSQFDYITGQSRLYSLSDPVNTLIAAFEANNVLLTNYGMMGILSPDPANNIEGLVVPMDDEKKKKVQEDMQRRYGVMRDQWPMLLTGQPVKYTAVGRPTSDLMLFETIQDTTRIITEAYKVPMFLLGFTSGTTFNNYAEANKSLYTDAIIPEVASFVDCFNRYFNNTSENMLRYSFDHIPALQANRLENEQSLKIAVERLKVEVEAGFATIDEAKAELSTLKD